jgi:hypothetical protein
MTDSITERFNTRIQQLSKRDMMSDDEEEIKKKKKNREDKEAELAKDGKSGWATQTIIVHKNAVSGEDEAKSIASKIGHVGKIDEKEDTWHFRQLPPENFIQSSFRTKVINSKVSIVMGKLK